MHKKRTFLVLLAALLALPLGAGAQGIGEGYVFSTAVDQTAWQTLPANATDVITSTGDYASSGLKNIGFSFVFCGDTVTQFSISADGNMRLGSTTVSTSYYTKPMQSSAYLNYNSRSIVAMGFDGFLTSNGMAKMAVLGDAGSRILVVELHTSTYTSATRDGVMQMQYQLYEGTNQIRLVYGTRTTPYHQQQPQVGIICADTDFVRFDIATNTMITYEAATQDCDATGAWPEAYRYYSMTPNPNLCHKSGPLSIVSTSTDGGTVSWTAGADESSWAVYLDGEFVGTTSLPEYTFSSLTANTAYTVGVRAVCGAGDTSNARAIVLRTDCADITLPFYDNFASYITGSGNFPSCWNRIRASSASYPYTLAGTYFGNNLYWYNNSVTDTTIFCSGLIPIEANNMYISLWLAASMPTYVGIATDTSDYSTFVPLLAVNNGNYWNQYEIYTDTVADMPTTTGVYLVVVSTGGSGSGNLDEVLVDNIGTCRRPVDGGIDSRTHNSATLHWTPDEGSTATTYDVLATTSFVTDENAADAVLLSGVSGTEATIDGLQPNTLYRLWVRANCGSEASTWAYIDGVTTYESCYPVSGLTVESTTLTSALVTFDYMGNGRGIDETGLHLALSDTSGVIREWDAPLSDGGTLFVGGLTSGMQYTLQARTLCDPDTAEGVSVSFVTSSCGEVTGTNYTSNSYVPFNRYYKYAYSQILYPMTAVAQMDSITGIAFAGTVDRSYTYTVDVYIGETDQTSLTNATQIPYSQLTRVAQNVSVTVHDTWSPIMFDNAYVPTGAGSNLVVVVDNNTGAYDGSGYYWRSHSAQGASLNVYSDNTNYDPANLTASLSAYNYRPDILFYGNCNTSCVGPAVAVTGVDVNSADLRWSHGMDESAWAVQYRIDSSSVWIDADAPADTFATVSGLDPRSLYHFRVGSLCGDDTAWGPANSGWTGCADLEELPYAEGFEQMPTMQDPLCWTVRNIYTNTNYHHYVQNSTKHNGQQSMNVYPYGVTYVASPKLPAGTDPANLEIDYWAYLNNSGQRYEVGLMTDPMDTSTFRVHYTSGGNGATWVNYTVYTDTTTLTADDDIYVAWRYFVANGYNCYLDDVTISLSTCRRPTDLHVAGLTHESATISWSGMDDGSYEYCVTTTNAQPADTVELLSGSDTAYTFTGLQGNTTYYVWVRTVCDGNATSWSSTFSFHTPCAPESMPWVEDFNTNALSSCWDRYTGDFATGSITSTTGGWSRSNDNHYQIDPDGYDLYFNIYSTNKYTVVTPSISIAGQSALLQFDVFGCLYGSNSSAFDADDRFIVAITTDGGANWTPLYMMGSDPTRDNMAMTALTASGTTISIPLTNYDGQTVRVAFYCGSYASGGDNYIAIDNIAVLSADCMRPINVTVNPDAESATISWTDLSSENEEGYVLIVNTTNNMTSNTARTFEIARTDSTFTVDQLQPTTTYYYFIRSACEENPTASSWTTGSFRTACLPLTLPLEDDFENYTSGNGSFPDCWTLVAANNYSSSTVYPYVYNYGSSRGKVLYMYGYGTATTNGIIVASPYIPAPLNELEVSLDVYASSSSSYRPINMYVGTDPYDSDTWTLVRALPQTGSWQTVELTTDSLTVTDSGYVIFTATTGYSTYTNGYLDNIYITQMNPCRRTEAVTVSGITPYTANVSWTEVNGAAGYRVKYNTVNNILTADSLADVTTNEASLSGLQNGSQYYVWVQTVCADGISDPRMATFETEISCYPISNLRRTGSNPMAVAYMWDIDPRGNEAQSVVIDLTDETDSTTTEITAEGIGYHIFTNLTEGHFYEATFRTVCDIDSAAGVTVRFSPSVATILGEACSEISGDQSTTIDNVPFYDRDRYSLSQTIYPLSSVDSNISQLTGIAFYNTIGDTHNVTIDVYIGQTSQSSFSGTTPISVASHTQVVSGYSFVAEDAGWVEIPFNTPYTISNTGNLVITVDNNTGNYTSYDGRKRWAYSSTTAGAAIQVHSDYTNYDPSNISSYTFTSVSSVPDIKFYGDCSEQQENNCYRPVVVVSDVDSISASVVWLGNSESYTVQYRMASDTTWTSETATASPATISGLQPGTNYQVRVVGTCEGNEYTSSTVRFMTDCAPVHIPFHYGQADLIANYSAGFSPCWSYSNTVYRSYNNGVYYVYSSTNGAWFALPEIAEPINTTQVRFTTATTASNMQMRVGVMESDQSVTWVDTIDVPQTANSYTGSEQVVYLDSYTGTGSRIVFGFMSTSTVYIHDMNVEALDACRIVTDVAVSNIGESTATVSWTAVEGQTQWLVYLNDTLVGTANAATYSLTGLSAMTQYTVGIRAYCGGTDTARMATANFRTTCGSITELPWYEDFEAVGAELHTSYPNAMTGDIMPCWDFTPSGSAAHMSFAYNNSSYTYGGGSAGYSLCFYPGVIGGNNIVALPVFAENISGLKMSYVTRPEGTSSSPGVFDVGYVTNVADSSSFVSVKHYSYSDFNNAYILDTVVFTNAPAGARIAFRHKANASNWYWFVDSIVVDHNGSTPGPQPGNCNAPTGLTLEGSTETTATVSWTAGGNETAWELMLDNSQELVSANATTYTFTDLEPGSDHSVRVRAVCSETSHSGWSAALQFSTLGIADVEAALGISLYPNPASSVVAVEANEAVSLNIIDQSGRVVYSSESEATKHSVDVSQMAKGAYYVRLTGQSGTAVRKLVVK